MVGTSPLPVKAAGSLRKSSPQSQTEMNILEVADQFAYKDPKLCAAFKLLMRQESNMAAKVETKDLK